MNAPEASAADGGASRRRRFLPDVGTAVVVLLLAALGAFLWRGSLDAGWISEDTSVVRRLQSRGALADWFGAQYGASAVRFWRPLVSTTLWLQLEATGPDPTFLRAFDALAHGLGALILYRLARALGCSQLGSGTAALLAFAFPHQGGTVTWIVGRVDALCWPLVVGTALLAVRGRGTLAAVAAFAAIATKEMGVAGAILAVVCACAAPRERCPRALVGALLACVGAAIALVWRSLALGTLFGGYPGTSAWPGLGALWAGVSATGPLIFVLPFVAALANVGGRLRSPVVWAALIAHVGSLVVVAPLLRSGGPTPEHARWMLVPDGILCLAWAGCFGVGPWMREVVRVLPSAVALVLAAGVFVDRTVDARRDVLEWTRAAAEAAAYTEDVRARVARLEPSDLPVFAVDPPRLDSGGGAYTLQYGLADRFRPPFGSAPREVWPWRPIYGGPTVLPAGVALRDGLLLPETIEHTLPLEGPRRVAIAGVDTRGARFRVAGEAELRVVLACELGYEFATLGDQPEDGFSVEAIFGAVGATELWRTLMLASDFGARRVEMFFASLDGSRTSRWVEVGWDEETVRLLTPSVSR